MAFEVNWIAAESKRGEDGVHISPAIPLHRVYKLSHTGLAATPWPSEASGTQTASGQRSKDEVFLFFWAIYIPKETIAGPLNADELLSTSAYSQHVSYA